MLARITPSPLKGTVPAIASKSMAHRLIICAALANGETHVTCNTTCADIEATVRCLTALGARIEDAWAHAPSPRSRTRSSPPAATYRVWAVFRSRRAAACARAPLCYRAT